MEHVESDLYRMLDEAERARIQKNAQELCSLLTMWATCYPVLCAYRAAQVSVMVASVLPEFPMPAALLVGKLILFVQSVDELADDRVLPYAEFLRAAERWDQIARGGQDHQPDPDDALGIVLASIRVEMAAYPLFACMRDLWSRRLWALLLAMAQEYLDGINHKLRGEDSLPKLDEYLMGGIHSVGYPFWATSALILLNEPDVLDHMHVINEVLLQTGAALRMYQDVRTHEKESKTGSPNAVTIMQHELVNSSLNRSMPERILHAKEITLHLADQYTRKCFTLLEPPLTRSGRFEQLTRRILAYHAHIYRSHWPSREVFTLPATDAYPAIHSR